MPRIIVVNTSDDWPIEISGVKVVSARDYLMGHEYATRRNARIFNLCRSYRYQSTGYYVSLLAAARGHRAFPSISLIQEMKDPAVVRIISEEIDELTQKSLKGASGEKFDLPIYFGRHMIKRYDKLAREFFKLFQAPLLTARFQKRKSEWKLAGIQLLSANDLPEEHLLYVIHFSMEYFAGHVIMKHRPRHHPYDMAILTGDESEPPSDKRAISKFIHAAEEAGFNTEIITASASARIAEYDALFIRETTNVNHHTFRISQRAAAEGLVVIDDPESIIKCANKVYLQELMNINGIATPLTMIVNRDNIDAAADSLGYPVILKQPDSSFSQGVKKADDEKAYRREIEALFEKSDLVIAQKFIPTEFDWRIGILGKNPLYACKYFMAKSHWQIMNWGRKGRHRYGAYETYDIEKVPPEVIDMALSAANLIGDGLYGVDVKFSNGLSYLIEVNDNPSIEAGVEDAVIRESLYQTIMKYFFERVKTAKGG
jgi:glutathione synthase/RimK-type ligase-like ATP-grasp enzyme